MDPWIDTMTGVILYCFLIWPTGGATSISCKFHQQEAPLALVRNLARWRHLDVGIIRVMVSASWFHLHLQKVSKRDFVVLHPFLIKAPVLRHCTTDGDAICSEYRLAIGSGSTPTGFR